MDLAGRTSLGDILPTQAAKPELANKPALYFADDVYTYAALAAACDRAAAALRSRRVRAGDAVALALPTSPALVAHLLGALRVGAAVVPLNPALTVHELSWLIEASGASVLVTTAELARRIAASSAAPALQHLIVVDPDERLDCRPAMLEPGAGAADATAFLIFTSGTTGRPKGVVLTHRNVLANTSQVAERTVLTPDDRVLHVMPLFHVNGLMNNTLLPLRAGASIVLRPRFELEAFWSVVERFRPTYFTAVPTVFTRLMDGWSGRADTSSLRFVRSGAAPMVPALQQLVEERLGVPVVLSYGLSEATCTCTMNPPNASRRLGSVGAALVDESVSMVDEDGAQVPVGQVGEIAIRGPNVMAGYLNAPEATAQVLCDGRLRTGDMGFVDADGFVFLTDRKKDLIIRGGENVSPREVEQVLASFPGVAEAAVVGAPDREWGEAVVAFLVLREGRDVSSETLQAFCRDRLARFKVPARMEVVASLPLTSVGKVDKVRLRGVAAGTVEPR